MPLFFFSGLFFFSSHPGFPFSAAAPTVDAFDVRLNLFTFADFSDAVFPSSFPSAPRRVSSSKPVWWSFGFDSGFH